MSINEIKLAVAWDSEGGKSTAPSPVVSAQACILFILLFLSILWPVYTKHWWQDETDAGKFAAV